MSDAPVYAYDSPARRPAPAAAAMTDTDPDLPLPTADEFAAAARRAWQARAAQSLAAAAAHQCRTLRAPAALVDQLDALARPDASGAGDPPLGPGAVLLVVAEPLVRACLAQLLEARGAAVLAAADGLEAVGLFEAERGRVGVAVVDADLPGWGAAGTVAELRRRHPGLAVAVLGDPAGKRLGITPSAVAPKPFTVADVLWAVREAG